MQLGMYSSNEVCVQPSSLISKLSTLEGSKVYWFSFQLSCYIDYDYFMYFNHTCNDAIQSTDQNLS